MKLYMSVITPFTLKCVQYNSDYITNRLQTPWDRLLLEKLTGSQLINKFPAFDGS
jgi:hypothetical protein